MSSLYLNLRALPAYRKIQKISDARKICRNIPKIQTKRPNLRAFRQKDANGIAKSEDPDRTVLHYLSRPIFPKLMIITVFCGA